MKKFTLLTALLAFFTSMGQTDSVTFTVDLSQYSGSFTTAYVSGTFNNWCGNCDAMADPDGDTVYTATIAIAADTIEYKFTMDDWASQENFSPGMPCTFTANGFTNRYLTKSGDTTLPQVCWNQCGATCKMPPSLPVDFDQSNVNYNLVSFGGNSHSIVADPAGGTNMVVEAVKDSTAQTWAGTTLGDAGLSSAIPFTANAHKMSIRVYSPAAGTPIRLKAEDASDPTISVETEDTTSMANAWETLTFDFSNEAPGTAAINYANTYDKVSIFFNFGTDGATAGTQTYYCDDLTFGTSAGGGGGGGGTMVQVDLPIRFDSTNVNYDLVSFGGNSDTIVTDPAGGSNMVMQADKGASAMTWAGTTMGGSGLASAIPFSASANVISVRVYSPASGTPIRLKVEDASDPNISVETEDTTTMANAWETLTFDFTQHMPGTPAIDYANTYDLVSIFFNFGTDGATAGAQTYYADDVVFTGAPGGGGGGGSPADTNMVTFQVDMSEYNGSFTTPEVNGQFNNWCGNCAPMTDADGDDIWEATIPIAMDSIEYKFSYDNWAGQESLDSGSVCTKTTAGFTNRFLMVTQDTTLPAVCYGYCLTCDQVSLEEYWVEDFSVSPNPTEGRLQVAGTLPSALDYEITITDLQGRVLQKMKRQGRFLNESIDLSRYEGGLYLLSLSSAQGSLTRKVLVR